MLCVLTDGKFSFVDHLQLTYYSPAGWQVIYDLDAKVLSKIGKHDFRESFGEYIDNFQGRRN